MHLLLLDEKKSKDDLSMTYLVIFFAEVALYDNNNSALLFCDTSRKFEPMEPSSGGGEGLIYSDLQRESRNLEGYEILGSPAWEVEQVLICLEASKD